MNNHEIEKVSWKGWVALIFLIISFSGALAKAGVWSAFDFQTLCGNFGEISKGINYAGKGGTGAKEGLMAAIAIIPTVMLALGFIQAAEKLGALLAGAKLFRPILRPLLGIPGIAGLAFVSSFTSSDVASVMTKGLYDEGFITDDERTIFVAYQYSSSATVTTVLTTGAALLPISVLPVGVVIGLLVIVKMIGANVVRILLPIFNRRKSVVNGGAANG